MLFYTWLSNRLPSEPWFCRLSPDLWAEAALLGAARLRSNDANRSNKRDRGGENARVDLMGAASEILLYRMLSRFARHVDDWAKNYYKIASDDVVKAKTAVTSGLQYMREHMYVEGAGGRDVEGADFMYTSTYGNWSIDAKSYDFASHKRRFAINEKKHNQLASLAPEYFCMLCPPLASFAFIAIAPYDSVSRWNSETLRPQNPDPAKVIPIDTFTSSFLGKNRDSCARIVFENLHHTLPILNSAKSGGEGTKRIAESSPLIGKILNKNPNILLNYVQQMLPQ